MRDKSIPVGGPLAGGYSNAADAQLSIVIDNLVATLSQTITYDDRNRLVQVAEGIPAVLGGTPIPIEDYSYDEEGNRLSSHLAALYSSNAHNQLIEDDDFTYAYDAKGNRISRTSKATGDVETYTYDSENRLVSYQSPTTVATYTFDALERRIAKTVNGVTTAYIMDQMGMPSTLEPSNIALVFEDSSGKMSLRDRWVYSDHVDEPLAYESYYGGSTPGSGTTQELFADRQGSITAVVDVASNRVGETHTYDGYGMRSSSGVVSGQLYGYRGREFDDESGLYHLRWRAYDPNTGTFLQMDPIGFFGGQENLYAYVDNNPLNGSDPIGLTVYADYRASIDGKKQMLGGVTRSVSSGVFALIANMIEAMNGDWNNFAGSVKTVDALGPGTGNKCHGNSGHNEDGMHIYVIYDRAFGKTRKVGIGNNKDLILDGAFSKRAMRQVHALGGPTKYGHVVLIKTPGGLMSRAQALIMEKMMVSMLSQLGMPVSSKGHSLPTADPDWCPL